MGLRVGRASAALALFLFASSQGGAAGMRLLGKYDGNGRGVEIGADSVRIEIPLDDRACHRAGRRATLYFKGLRADAGPHPGYRVLLVRRDAPASGKLVGEFNFYGSGPGIRQDVSFELFPDLLISGQRPCVVRLLLQAVGAMEKTGSPAVGSIEIWSE